jgi:hypothetical protein
MLSMGKAYITGCIQAMDGEKDPRNLVTCFNLATFMLTQFHPSIAHEFIEVISHSFNFPLQTNMI